MRACTHHAGGVSWACKGVDVRCSVAASAAACVVLYAEGVGCEVVHYNDPPACLEVRPAPPTPLLTPPVQRSKPTLDHFGDHEVSGRREYHHVSNLLTAQLQTPLEACSAAQATKQVAGGASWASPVLAASMQTARGQESVAAGGFNLVRPQLKGIRNNADLPVAAERAGQADPVAIDRGAHSNIYKPGQDDASHVTSKGSTFLPARQTAAAVASSDACVNAGQCGARGVKFLKLHKVASSTIATAIEEYALRHPCTY